MVRGLSRWLLAAAVGSVLMPAGARAVSIDIGSASGAPGDAVTVAVSLHTMGVSVIATQNRIDFEPETPVAATASGDPDCAVKPAIHKAATSFLFLPLGCDPAVACQSVRALVFALDNVSTIRDGAVLYTCRIAIAADAQPGAYALSNAGGADLSWAATNAAWWLTVSPSSGTEVALRSVILRRAPQPDRRASRLRAAACRRCRQAAARRCGTCRRRSGSAD